MANKQPFYHRVVVLFAATEPLGEAEFVAALEKALKPLKLVKGSVEAEEFDEPEPGDPADLM